MTLKELKKSARRCVGKWCDYALPEDGDFNAPEVITDRVSGNGCVADGDYAVILIFHNNKEVRCGNERQCEKMA